MKQIAPPARESIAAIVRLALAEDIGDGDISAGLIPAGTRAQASLVARQAAVLCGVPWANEVLRQIDPSLVVTWLAADGDAVTADQVLARFSGDARGLLTAERSLLNFLQTLSGTATVSRHYAQLVASTGVTLLDTRKTLPGLRQAQKYAVRVGGCQNHRMGLFDAFLIKENHIRACGSITAAVAAARKTHPARPVEVEIEHLDQLEEALTAGAATVMLDNFDVDRLRQAVGRNRQRAKLEASGGVTRENLLAIAKTGVDYISLGALTKDCKAVDLSLLFAPPGPI